MTVLVRRAESSRAKRMFSAQSAWAMRSSDPLAEVWQRRLCSRCAIIVPADGPIIRCVPDVANGIGLIGGIAMNVLGVILARAGSVGLPDKHLLPLLGKPVIAYTFDHARAARC